MSDMQKYIEVIGNAIVEAIAIDGYAEVKVNDQSVGILRLNAVASEYEGKSIVGMLENIN